MNKLRSVCFWSTIIMILIAIISLWGLVIAVPAYDQEAGVWSYDFINDTGLSTKVNVGVSNGTLTLTNSSGGFFPPYNAIGYGITTTIIPTSVAQWGNISFTADIPVNTSIRIQVLDEGNYVYNDTYLFGNSEGFANSTIDISSLQVDTVAANLEAGEGGPKFAHLRLRITLNTTNASITPSLINLTLSWVVRRGDLSASPLANTAWPTTDVDSRGTRHTPFYSDTIYPAIRWVKDLGIDHSAQITRGTGELIFVKTGGGIISWPNVTKGKLLAVDRNTGETVWGRNISGTAFTTTEHTLSESGTLYISDIFNDILLAYDTSDGGLKWTYQFNHGHSNSEVAIDGNGSIYTIRENTRDITVYAFYSNGSVKWTKNISFPADSTSSTQIVFGNDSLYFGTVTFNNSCNDYSNQGRLFALNMSDGSTVWNYSTGDIGLTPLVDTEGIIYVANYGSFLAMCGLFEKKMYAFYPNGSVKWERSIGSPDHFDAWVKLSLRSDGVLLADRSNLTINISTFLIKESIRIIEALNITNGNLLWNESISNVPILSGLFSDGLNGFYFNYLNFNIINFKTMNNTIYYYDSSYNKRWGLSYPEEDNIFGRLILDEDNRGYTYLSNSSYPNHLYLFSLFPWTLSASTDSQAYKTGARVTFTATTAMQPTNLLSGKNNKVQVVMDNGDKILLNYTSTTSEGDSVWTGRYTLPPGMSIGTHSFVVEANAAGVETDIPVHFDSPENSTNNTGINLSGRFKVAYPDGSLCSSDTDCFGNHCVHGFCRSSPNYCGDRYCDSGEYCGSCYQDCGFCHSGGSSKGKQEMPKASHGWDEIKAGGTAVMVADSENLSLTRIIFKVKEEMVNPRITVKAIKSNPVEEIPDALVYGYMKISKENLGNYNLEEAEIEFKVSRTWIGEKNVDKDRIYMNRYVDNIWQKLPTRLVNETADYLFYRSKTEGFSYFAISGEICRPEAKRCNGVSLEIGRASCRERV